ncbi:alpha/beta hydrolase family protein [Pedobacter metabolipauper]|uniref:Bile acid acyltransferase/acyl-CoA thioester hydrolase-like protein n=1 Tax=Pedobacter metabolipauper TaxID=425513 RepID=A0A4R6SUV5_9SPHI|nr:hypothetical protein [Pedobacter metabolipauper]TDQ08793.1 bile acid acyltransferase/acyl-CoA thioester hydrolase-like protein [Pedobacter metabolipauper]
MQPIKWILLFFSLFNSLLSVAQPIHPADYGLKSFTLRDKKLGKISFYLDTININKKAPLFLDVNGSGGYPLCFLIKGKGYERVMNTFKPFHISQTQVQYHYILLDKPGTPFCDTIYTDQGKDAFNGTTLLESYRPSPAYTQQMSLEWRINASKAVLNYLVSKNYWDRSQMIAFGYSEGAQVVPALAVAEKKISHVAAVVGSGLNQFYDEILQFRINAAIGKMTHPQAQDSIESKMKEIEAIYRDPANTTREYRGHSFQRWASFGSSIPFEELRKLDIPIYVVASSNDRNSPIYSLDYLWLDFIRLGKTNLTYKTCVDCNHSLISGKDDKALSNYSDYFMAILKWIK